MMVYKVTTFNNLNDISKISTSTLISTSLDIKVTDSFYS